MSLKKSNPISRGIQLIHSSQGVKLKMFKQMKIYVVLMESAYMFLIQLMVLSNQPPIGDFLVITYGKCKPSNHVPIVLFISMVLHRRLFLILFKASAL